MYDIAIVGAGIAGLTAAIYGRRAGKSVLVLEGKVYGGQIINTFSIENWPGDYKVSGVDLMGKIYRQAVDLGAEVEYEEVIEIVDKGEYKEIIGEDEKYQAKTVILAVGAEDKKLDIPGEEKLAGRGVSYCATCDGALFKDKTVAIIGGGNTALYDTLYLSSIVKKIYLVHRRDEFRGDAALAKRVKAKENVEFILGYVPEEIMGDKKVSGVKLVPSGLVKDVSDGRELAVDGIFVAVGEKPATEKFATLVELDKNGYVVAGEDCKTSRDGVYVAGDCRTKDVRQLVTAASDGAVAAEAVARYLDK